MIIKKKIKIQKINVIAASPLASLDKKKILNKKLQE